MSACVCACMCLSGGPCVMFSVNADPSIEKMRACVRVWGGIRVHVFVPGCDCIRRHTRMVSHCQVDQHPSTFGWMRSGRVARHTVSPASFLVYVPVNSPGRDCEMELCLTLFSSWAQPCSPFLSGTNLSAVPPKV